MPIVITDRRTKEVKHKYDGRVIDVRQRIAHRNLSDTLDYSDYQDVKVTEALVYLGRSINEWGKERVLETHEWFKWVDCSNLFGWRGAPHEEAFVDEGALQDHTIATDYQIWQKELEIRAEREAEARRRCQQEEEREKLERERNRPVKGKKMIVVKGRKVPKGTIGVVAFVHENGGVLLKDEKSWQDRNTQGVWVNRDHLRAV